MAVADKEEYRIVGVTSAPVLNMFRSILPAEYDRKKGEDTYLLGAVDENDEPCGVCWYRYTRYAYEILFIGVHPEYRRKGVGTLLLRSFLESLYKMNMVLPVRAVYTKEDTNGFDEFMSAQKNFFYMDADQNFKVRKRDRDNSKIYQRMLGMSSSAKPFFNQSPTVRKAFLDDQHKKGLWFLDGSNMQSDLYEKDLCFCTEEDDYIYSVILIKKDHANIRELSYIYVDDEHPKHGMAIMNLISAAGKVIEETCPDTTLIVQTVNAESNKLLRELFVENNPVYTEIKCVMWDFSI
ncbi:MAG: GNAT family N-acetyltransferase [Lachnospiraceae bacterium]|nr:GNAT family N-acetyltransferase [Lachnospiraceae bacterium]